MYHRSSKVAAQDFLQEHGDTVPEEKSGIILGDNYDQRAFDKISFLANGQIFNQVNPRHLCQFPAQQARNAPISLWVKPSKALW